MQISSINPANGRTLKVFTAMDKGQVEDAISLTRSASTIWSNTGLEHRKQVLREAAKRLRKYADDYAALITLEMGKLQTEALAEIEKCALVCEYYADNADTFLADEPVETDAGKSFITYQPLGTVLAVMPWNFPFWQVFRFAVPALLAGNTVLLKHASNVPQCALAIDQLWNECGLPPGGFQTLLIGARDVEQVIAHPDVHGVTLTGSEAAGIKVATAAARHMKKSVLELGGSDPFIVLEDADLDLAVENALKSRFLNAGQVCIAAKRFIVHESVVEAFTEALKIKVDELVLGDPTDPSSTLAPMARTDLRDELHRQVERSISAGAKLVTGGGGLDCAGAFYRPTILTDVVPGMAAFEEEIFGPVAAITTVMDEDEALKLANMTRFGLGATVWTQDAERGELLARRIEAGSTFINGMVKSDPRLPFGGIKASGYGRELSRHGMLEFCNIKTVWVR